MGGLHSNFKSAPSSARSNKSMTSSRSVPYSISPAKSRSLLPTSIHRRAPSSSTSSQGLKPFPTRSSTIPTDTDQLCHSAMHKKVSDRISYYDNVVNNDQKGGQNCKNHVCTQLHEQNTTTTTPSRIKGWRKYLSHSKSGRQNNNDRSEVEPTQTQSFDEVARLRARRTQSASGSTISNNSSVVDMEREIEIGRSPPSSVKLPRSVSSQLQHIDSPDLAALQKSNPSRTVKKPTKLSVSMNNAMLPALSRVLKYQAPLAESEASLVDVSPMVETPGSTIVGYSPHNNNPVGTVKTLTPVKQPVQLNHKANIVTTNEPKIARSPQTYAQARLKSSTFTQFQQQQSKIYQPVHQQSELSSSPFVSSRATHVVSPIQEVTMEKAEPLYDDVIMSPQFRASRETTPIIGDSLINSITSFNSTSTGTSTIIGECREDDSMNNNIKNTVKKLFDSGLGHSYNGTVDSVITTPSSEETSSSPSKNPSSNYESDSRGLIDDELRDQPPLESSESNGYGSRAITKRISFSKGTQIGSISTTPADSKNNSAAVSPTHHCSMMAMGSSSGNNSDVGGMVSISQTPVRKIPRSAIGSLPRSMVESYDSTVSQQSVDDEDLMLDFLDASHADNFDSDDTECDYKMKSSAMSGSLLRRRTSQRTGRSHRSTRTGSINDELASLLSSCSMDQSIMLERSATATTGQSSRRQQLTSSVSQSVTPLRTLRPPSHLSSVTDSLDLSDVETLMMCLDGPSFRYIVQDLTVVKTLLLRLKRVLQDAETINPFESSLVMHHHSSTPPTTQRPNYCGSTNTTTEPHCGTANTTTEPHSQSFSDDHNKRSLSDSVTNLTKENESLQKQVKQLNAKLDKRDQLIRQLQGALDKGIPPPSSPSSIMSNGDLKSPSLMKQPLCTDV